MNNENISRRKLLERSLQLSFGGAVMAAVVAQSADAAEKVCFDMETGDAGQKGIRESLNYVEKSNDPKQICAMCGFFEATGDGCGTCMIFTGPANANGHCDSWSAKG